MIQLSSLLRIAVQTTPEGARRGNLIAAEQAAFEIQFIRLARARALGELYPEKGDRRQADVDDGIRLATPGDCQPTVRRSSSAGASLRPSFP